jgi:hypothetical protein
MIVCPLIRSHRASQEAAPGAALTLSKPVSCAAPITVSTMASRVAIAIGTCELTIARRNCWDPFRPQYQPLS